VTDTGRKARHKVIDGSLADFKPWEFGVGEATKAQLKVDADQAAWACHITGSDAEPSEDGSVLIELDVRKVEAFRTLVMGLRHHAEVLGPPELRAGIIFWLRELT